MTGFGGGVLHPEPSSSMPDRRSPLPDLPPIVDRRRIHAEGYASPLIRARILRILLLGWAGFVGVAIAYEAVLLTLVRDAIDHPLSASGSDFATAAEAVRRVVIAQLFAFLASVIVTATWLWRVYSNLPALGATRLRFGRGWVLGAWIVPFLNLVRPKSIVDDAWRGSDPSAPDSYGYPEAAGPRSPLVAWWWGLWIAWLFSVRLFPDRILDMRDLRDGLQIDLLRGLMLVGSGLCLYALVTRLSVRQIERARRLGIAHSPAVTWTTSVRSGGHVAVRNLLRVFAPVGVVAVCGLAAALTLDIGLERPPVDPDAEGVLVTDLAVGDCYDLPEAGAIVIAAELVNCSEPHEFELIAIVSHNSSLNAPYPGQQVTFEAAVDLCMEPFEAYVGATYDDSVLDILVLYPLEESWESGDRLSSCSAYRLDGGMLSESVRLSGL
jgi:hypothetical protein